MGSLTAGAFVPATPTPFIQRGVGRFVDACEDQNGPPLRDVMMSLIEQLSARTLAMAGVLPLTIKELGGWKTMVMVQRYAHLAPNHLHEAVERLVSMPRPELARN